MDEARILNSRRSEFLFLIFPFWIPLVYLALIRAFPANPVLVFTLFVLVLGETHFAATWLFFSLPSNRSWVKKNLNKIIVVPAVLLTLYFAFSLYSPAKGALLGSLFSAVHVTRQSIGVARLYRAPRNGIHEILIYVFSGIFLMVGAVRFFVPESVENVLFIFTTFTLRLIFVAASLIMIFLIFVLYKNKMSLNLATTTGMLMYAPYVFVTNPMHAVAMGVGMHWCQYLALTYKIYLRDLDVIPNIYTKRTRNLKNIKKFVFIVSYAFITTAIITKLGTVFSWRESILAIPLTLQAFHYYLDAFIWKFSDPEIRINIGSRLFSSKPTKS
jgi:hypothetical protein